MSVITHTVAADEVDVVRRALLEIYSVKAEALHGDLIGYLEHRSKLREITDHRSEIAAIEEILDQLGWALVSEPRAVTVTASRDLLVEAYRAGLSEAAEHFSAGAGMGGWPLDDIARVDAALALSRTLLSRLEDVARAAGDGVSLSCGSTNPSEPGCQA